MKCHDYEFLIALHIEGDLPEKKRGIVLEHLSRCESCQLFAEELKASQRILKSLRDEPLDEGILRALPDQVTVQIVSHLKTSPIPTIADLWHRWRWQALFGAGVLALLVVLMVSPQFKPPTRDRQVSGEGQNLAIQSQNSTNLSGQAVLSSKGSASLATENNAGFHQRSRLMVAPTQPSEPFRATKKRQEGPNPIPAEMKEPTQVSKLDQGATQNVSSRSSPVSQTTAIDFTEPADQMVIQLVTDDPNIVIVWLVDQKRGKENEQN
jgi:anti-sigma factor RsiW